MALRTRLLDREETLRDADFAAAVARGTRLWLRSRLGTTAMAGLAFVHRRNADLDFRPASRVFERQLEVVAKIGAAIDAAAALAALLPEDLAEDVAERIRESAEAFGAARTGRAESDRRVDARVPELIVRGALLPVGQDLVRFLGFLELVFGALFRVAIRMVLHRELAIRLLDVVVGCVAVETEHRVVITLRHGIPNCPQTVSGTTGASPRLTRLPRRATGKRRAADAKTAELTGAAFSGPPRSAAQNGRVNRRPRRRVQRGHILRRAPIIAETRAVIATEYDYLRSLTSVYSASTTFSSPPFASPAPPSP